MARRLVTVGDDLVLHSSVTVPIAQVTGAGTAAAAATGDFATAAQGGLADTATQPGDLGNAAGLDVGTTAGTVAAGDDSRLSDARTPTAHASTHATGQSDAIAPGDIGAATAAQGALADTAVQPGDLDTAVTALDANAASALRVQQDARLSSTYVTQPASLDHPLYPLRPLREILDGGQSACIVVLGDSTGNDPSEWVRTFTSDLASAYPDHAVRYRLWADGSQSYGAPEDVQVGDLRGLAFSTQGGWHLKPTRTSADLDIRVQVTFDAWPVAATSTLVCHGHTSGSFAFRWTIAGTGQQVFRWSGNGTALNYPASSANLSTEVEAGTPIWLRVTFDSDNGAGGSTIAFYRSADAVTWTQVGGDVTSAAGPIFDSLTEYEVGAEGTSTGVLDGTIHAAHVLDGIGGPILTPLLIDDWNQRSASTSSRVGDPVIEVVNGSHPGAGTTYLADATRLPKLVHTTSAGMVLISCSHNEGHNLGAEYLSDTWDAFLTALRARVGHGAAIALVLQNPQISPAAYVYPHTRRRPQLAAWARANGLSVFDACAAFKSDARGVAALLEADGIHPNTAGSEVWKDAAMGALGPAAT